MHEFGHMSRAFSYVAKYGGRIKTGRASVIVAGVKVRSGRYEVIFVELVVFLLDDFRF